MKSFLWILLASLIYSCCGLATEPLAEASPPAANAATFEDAFKQGVQYSQTKDYENAKNAFAKALEFDSENVGALTNLALVQYHLEQKGWALALLRKAHSLDPQFSTPLTAIRFIEKRLETKEIPHVITFYGAFQKAVLAPVSLMSMLIFLSICFLATGWLWIEHLAEVRRLRQQNSRTVQFPALKFFISFIFFVVLTLTVLKVIDQKSPRGTIVVEKVTALSAPTTQAVPLLELYAGLEVKMEQEQGEWVQVTYPGTPSAWIPKSSVFKTSSEF